MADGNPLTAAWCTMSSCRFLELANAQPEMTAKIFRGETIDAFIVFLESAGRAVSVCWIDVPLGSPAP